MRPHCHELQIYITVKSTFTQVNNNNKNNNNTINNIQSSYLSQCFHLGRKSPYRILNLRRAGHGKAAKAIKRYMGITVM